MTMFKAFPYFRTVIFSFRPFSCPAIIPVSKRLNDWRGA
jgi:hypothetical protein